MDLCDLLCGAPEERDIHRSDLLDQYLGDEVEVCLRDKDVIRGILGYNADRGRYYIKVFMEGHYRVRSCAEVMFRKSYVRSIKLKNFKKF